MWCACNRTRPVSSPHAHRKPTHGIISTQRRKSQCTTKVLCSMVLCKVRRFWRQQHEQLRSSQTLRESCSCLKCFISSLLICSTGTPDQALTTASTSAVLTRGILLCARSAGPPSFCLISISWARNNRASSKCPSYKPQAIPSLSPNSFSDLSCP